jgi:hypothetical protein
VSEAALRVPAFRKSLPAGYAQPGFDREAARVHLGELGATLAKEMKLDPALDLLADTFIRSRGTDNRFAIRDAARPVGENDRFRAQPRAHWRLAEDGDKLVVIAAGGELEFTPDKRAALERALGGEAFTPKALGGEDAVAITSRLLAYGLIARA